MVLLVLLVIGLLSLSSVALRKSSNAMAMAEARANARVALIVALGELQMRAGPDTRVTAPGDIIDGGSSTLTGVWRSWEGKDHETDGRFAGRPVTPDYGAKERTESDGGRFLSWLVSAARSTTSIEDAAKLTSATASETSVPLLSTGTLSAGSEREVHVTPVPVSSRGAMAWWASGENQKARLPKPYEPHGDTISGWVGIANSHAVADPSPFGLDPLLVDPDPAEKAISLNTVGLLRTEGDAEPDEFFHDLSTSSVGLLTNTATGGWRKDLSLLSENWGRQPRTGLPLFRISPDRDSQAVIPTRMDPVPDGAMVYPWAAYRGSPGEHPIFRTGASSSWAHLIDHVTHYKRVSIGSTGRASTSLHSVSVYDGANTHDYHHKIRILPVIARIQWVFSHGAQELPPAEEGAEPLYEPRLHLTPVVTLWNPYNVAISCPPNFRLQMPVTLPTAFRYSFDGQKNPDYNALTTALNNQPPLSWFGEETVGRERVDFLLRIAAPFNLIPGETRLFSPKSTNPVKHSRAQLNLGPGYRPGGGYYFQVRGARGESPLKLPGSTRIKADARFDTKDRYREVSHVGVYLDLQREDKKSHLAYRMFFTEDTANAVYSPLSDMAETSLEACSGNPLPFLSAVFGARTASSTHMATKGFIQSNPMVNHARMRRTGDFYYGQTHPVNSPSDFSFVKHAPGGDSLLPNVGDTTNRSYIVTGFSKADGLARCVIAELPLLPLASLAELTHWDARFDNPAPPYSLNQVANSDASPLIQSDAVLNSKDAGEAINRQNDDSYCMNHLLFDDWFVSSIAPDSRLPGSAGRGLEAVHADFLTGTRPLVNRAYRPILADMVSSAEEAAEIYSEHVEPADAWKTIAARLEVEGMFNVNSTSVIAWRALLGHARDQKVPHIRGAAPDWDIGLSAESDHIFNRFSVAADSEAGTIGDSGAFPEATQFAGYRTVDPEFIDAMAEEVVSQIRLRGPFLSLSEFVNRQLSSGDLALAGTIQGALNALSKQPALDPFAHLKALSTVSIGDPPNVAGHDEGYQFRKAVEGHSAYGMPGWTRQADILRPLAPILSVRDDTFTIRAYGDARDAAGSVIAQAWCEATVRRMRDYVDPSDEADRFEAPEREINRRFGRRFEMVSFRWLSPKEV
ncbi:hypothetical protein [Haloferula sp. A504]|uniref:hypothetical protein n=1 Tax=Haloferula sp. A504 TaxID=3373601 RepID=UPI0031BCE5A9|nr:hypothetical protein [Verrucomicrobiaceae bacterium E54]